VRLLPTIAVTALLALGSAVLPTSASAADAVLQGERLSLSARQGQVVSDSKASGRSAMALWWTVDAAGSLTTTGPAKTLVVRARGDQYLGAPKVTVLVDGVKVGVHEVAATSWTDYRVSGSWAAGRHDVSLRYVEGPYAGRGRDQNLYVDSVTFAAGSQAPTTTPAPVSPPAASPAPAPSAAPGPRTVTAFVTGYTLFDNDPPGSKAIAYPVLHEEAGGTGTYDDPITLAVGRGKYAPGTRFYLPHVKRYFIVEDLCAACNDKSQWIDMWIGGEKGDNASAADTCARHLTGTFAVEVHPPRGRSVTPGPLFASGRCTV
jgi:hypothetical protein